MIEFKDTLKLKGMYFITAYRDNAVVRRYATARITDCKHNILEYINNGFKVTWKYQPIKTLV